MVMQIRRTLTADNAPSGLAEGQLACELASDPPKLWVGVPTSLDPSGRRLVVPSPGGVVAFGVVPPVSPNPGDLWFDPVEGQLYIYFQDANSSQWVVTINQGGGGGGAGGPQMGVTDGSNAAPGQIGEFLTSANAGFTAPPDPGTTIVTLTLTPGDWQVWATVEFGEASGNWSMANTTNLVVQYAAQINAPSADFISVISVIASYPLNASDIGQTGLDPRWYYGFAVPMRRVNVAASTLVSLVARANVIRAGTGPMATYTMCNGYLNARRMR